MNDAFGIACNFEGDAHISPGTKCWLVHRAGDNERYMFYARSRGGRSIHKWLNLKRCYDWRVVWVPEHLRDRVAAGWPTREKAQEFLTPKLKHLTYNPSSDTQVNDPV